MSKFYGKFICPETIQNIIRAKFHRYNYIFWMSTVKMLEFAKKFYKGNFKNFEIRESEYILNN